MPKTTLPPEFQRVDNVIFLVTPEREIPPTPTATVPATLELKTRELLGPDGVYQIALEPQIWESIEGFAAEIRTVSGDEEYGSELLVGWWIDSAPGTVDLDQWIRLCLIKQLTDAMSLLREDFEELKKIQGGMDYD